MKARSGTLLRGRRSGQGLVELALALPLLLLLVLGVVEFARVWNIHQVLTDAGREGARTLVVSTYTTTAETTDSVEAVVRRAIARMGVDPADATINVTHGALSGDPGTVDIELPYQLRILQPFMGWTTSDATFTLRASTTMRTE